MAAPFATGTGSKTGMEVRVILDHTALASMLSGRTGDLANVKRGFASRATRNARQIARTKFDAASPYRFRRTGKYVRSISSSFPKGDELRIEANVPYAAAIELGARPHPILGHPFLQFQWFHMDPPMSWYSAPAVYHPGNKPYLILTDAVMQTAKEMGF